MRSLVWAELLKLRSTRSAWIPLAIVLAIAAVAVVANTSAAGHGGNPPLSPGVLPGLLRASGGQLVDGAVLLAWIVLSAGEFRHRTSVTTFPGEPRGSRCPRARRWRSWPATPPRWPPVARRSPPDGRSAPRPGEQPQGRVLPVRDGHQPGPLGRHPP